MSAIFAISALPKLMAMSQGDENIRIAVLDGPVDQAHPCFTNASLTRMPSLVKEEARTDGNMSVHGTHVSSIIFGQPGSSVTGIAPKCKGIIVPVFSDNRRTVSQLDLARGIERAVDAGAQVINISGGQLTDFGEADGWLENAVRLCQEQNVLLVAAAGNNGCECLHVPAALSSVLAVGAMDENGQPLDFSNWGEAYRNQGILALGKDVLGAKPGGTTQTLSGTSFATPIVSGVAALLLSIQRERGDPPDPQKVRQVLLQSALPCDLDDLPADADRCLAGKLNISGAVTLLNGGNMTEELSSVASVDASEVEAAGCGCDGGLSGTAEAPSADPGQATATLAAEDAPASLPSNTPNMQNLIQYLPQQSAMPNLTANSVTASQAPSELPALGSLVYALGTLGYDFGTEARRDSFKQLMPPGDFAGTQVPANPYDARQMVDYLENNVAESRSLIWTLNIELTPVYAIDPSGPFAADTYRALTELLSGQIQAESNAEYIERVSIPGIQSKRTVKLYSGQIIPVIEPQSTRGLYGWKVNDLVAAALETVQTEGATADEGRIRQTLDGFLNRIYYDLRNLGTTSQDRALNFSVTNAFQAAETFSEAVAIGMELDSVTVEKSPFCRMDSDCWDVKLKFFDPENNRRAKKIFRFTIDVSDLIPVTLGEVRSWSSPY